MEYIYYGDRFTASAYKKQPCKAIRNSAGKCIRGANGSMLVEFGNGKQHVIIGRLLRKIK
jgi:hypothetical protein